MYSKQTIKKVDEEADIRDIIPGADNSKTKQTIDCPFCGAKKKFGITHNSKYNSAKCYSCKEGYSGPIDAFMRINGYGKDKFPQAVEEVAKKAGLTIQTEEEERKEFYHDQEDRVKDTFCNEQLASSGLKLEDVMATTTDGKTVAKESPFQPGTFGPGYRIDKLGSDMMIYYIDLHGRYMTYMPKGLSQPRRYARVRFANPELHKVKDKPAKYMSPAGAPSRAYIPEYIRAKFQAKEHIETLFLQEGEKKAEKACKHGMPSIGLQGISNIGTADSGLIQDIQDVVRVCSVRNVVLMMDADWSDLHKEIKVNDRVDKRPNNFSSAVIKFKQFMASFHNLGIEVESWWGHVNATDLCDKGIDDLLLNTLKARESELIKDAERAMNTANGKGEFVTIVKISTMTDMKIRDFWHLNDHQAFYDFHRRRLEKIPSFRLGGFRYKVENDKMIAMSRYSSNADIYSVTINDKEEKKVSLNYTETFRFLSDSGFKIFVDPDSPKNSGFEFVFIDNGIIEPTSDFHIRNFICRYIDKMVKDPVVKEYFNAKVDVLLNEKKLQRLDVVENLVTRPEALKSNMYFNNGKVQITSSSIIPEMLLQNVWRSTIVARPFKRIPVINYIRKKEDGSYTLEVSEMGDKCDFLHFLLNTSNNFFKSDSERDLTPEEEKDVTQHLVNKITAIGYLLSEWKPDGERKSVIIQDHQMSEVGQNSGRAGKSLVGDAISRIIDQEFIVGSKYDPHDRFAFDNVSRNTRNVFIDDVKTNFDFKSIYPMITGDFVTDRKQIGKLIIPVELSPKFLITTNHAINNSTEDSTKGRIIYMEFSNWYSAEYTPYNDFGHYFFSEWDDLQWCLFDNLMAECVMYYFQSYEQGWAGQGVGAVPPPMTQIKKRSLRQFMGEVFFQWAEEYYDPTSEHLNQREYRNDIHKNFLAYAGEARHGVTQSNISKRLQAYCEFKGYAFNPDKRDKNGRYFSDWRPSSPDDVFVGSFDKSGGKEYFTVFCPEKPASVNAGIPF